jgi:hypothetical protein
MKIIPIFGSSFAVYAPLITALIGVITFFNVYARILKSVGIQEEDSVMGADFCHKMTSTEIEEIESGKRLVLGQIRTLGQILSTDERSTRGGRGRGDAVELIGGNMIRSDQEESVDSSINSSQNSKGEDVESQDRGLTFRERALAFGNNNKPAYVSLRGSSPGAELDSSNVSGGRQDEAVTVSSTSKSKEEDLSENDWNLPTTAAKKYGRYG